MTEGVRWLSSREQQAWRAYLHADRLLRDGLERQLRRDAQMSHVHYQILVHLSECPDRNRSMSSLARLVDISPSRLSHAMDTLESRGWVSRCRDAHNGRIVVAGLTDAGLAALTEAAPGHVNEVRRRVFDRLTGEQIDAMAAIAALMAGPEIDRA